MFFGNEVIKFRDISLRGAWTSGGIEINYGVIGHAPSCAFPVDYLTRQNHDGSASCFINVLDLLTRTHWTVEINLPNDKGWFSLSSFWHNANSDSQPYYNWVNSGIKAGKDLELIYPGTYSISHGGETIPWPMDVERGKNLSRWVENDFGGAKSYHIAGVNLPYYGAFWANDNFGIIHYAERNEKLGKKFFTLEQSDDKGVSWTYQCPIAIDEKGSFNETSVYETPKGDIIAFLRTAGMDDQACIARSTDGGKSFKWQSMGFQGHPLNALRLPDNRVLVTYGYRHPPYGIRVRILNAECTDFATSEEFILRDDGSNGDIGYTWPVQLDEKRVMVVYYYNKNDGDRHIAGTIIEIK